MNRAAALLLALISTGLLAGVVGQVRAQENWPQFRGPLGNGISHTRRLPLTWSETNNVVWKTPIHGKGWSSPVVWSNAVWMTTATPDGRELWVVKVDRVSGRILLDQKLFTVEKPQYADRFNSYASPTPVVDDGHVYVSFGSPGIACLDAETGHVLWERRDFVCNHFRGAASSPVLFLDRLFFNFDGADRQYVAAVDRKTGKTVWETRRSVDFHDLGKDGLPEREGDWRKAFSTPIVLLSDARFTLISLGSKALYSYDLATGSELWRTEEPSSHSGTVRPVAGLGMVFYCTGLPKGQLWAVRPGGTNNVTESHVAWKVSRNVPTRPSPLLVGDHLYMVDDGGIASCIAARTGEEVWRERIGGNYSASPVFGAGRLYFFNEEGKSTVLQEGKEFRVLATNQLDDGFMASPAIYGRSLILRTRTHLYRIEEREPKTP
jgi:outer membrane protein assembly factor BamB